MARRKVGLSRWPRRARSTARGGKSQYPPDPGGDCGLRVRLLQCRCGHYPHSRPGSRGLCPPMIPRYTAPSARASGPGVMPFFSTLPPPQTGREPALRTAWEAAVRPRPGQPEMCSLDCSLIGPSWGDRTFVYEWYRPFRQVRPENAGHGHQARSWSASTPRAWRTCSMYWYQPACWRSRLHSPLSWVWTASARAPSPSPRRTWTS